jgi:hypothetical protein
MSDLNALVSDAAQRFGVPAPILLAVGMQESGLKPIGVHGTNPAVGTEHAVGMFGIKPSTAKGLGVDPADPSSAAYGAAKYLRQGFDKTGNWDDAVRYFHGGPDTRQWGPRTEAYHSSVSSRASQGSSPAPQSSAPDSDPYLAGMEDHATSSPSVDADPFLAGLDSGHPADQANPGNGVHDDHSGQRPAGPEVPQGHRGGGSQGWWAALEPISNAIANGGDDKLGTFGRTLQDNAAGVVHGISKVPQFLMNAAGSVVGAVGAPKAADKLHGWADAIDNATSGLASDPESPTFKTRTFGGEVAATWPLAELKLLKAAPEAGKLAQGLAKYGNMALQGGAMNAVAAGGHDIAKNAAIGAATAPVLGVGFEKVAEGGSKLAGALKTAVAGEAAPEAAVHGDVAAPLQELINSITPENASTVGPQIDAVLAANKIARGDVQNLDAAIAYRAAGNRGTVPVLPKDAPVKPDPKDVAAAMGSRATRTGIEANDGLTPQVSERVGQLTSQDVPLDQALSQARIESIGAKPVAADVSRDPSLMRATKEGAKLDTTEGRALSGQIAENNGAAIKSMTDTVQGYGGAPAPGAAMESAAQSLDKASQAERTRVSGLYEKAAETDGAQLAPTKPLASVLSDPRNVAAVTNEGRAFVRGMQARLKILDPKGEGMTADALEQLRQSANEALGATTPNEVRALVGKVKGAIDESFDQLATKGDGYKAARAAHQKWAAQYDNQGGVSGLIAKDGGKFLNADNWRAADALISKTKDADFVQIVRQLKKIGDAETLNKLKAHIVQDAYQNATGRAAGNAVDQLRNSPVSGKMFFARLNQIGEAKLSALFSKEEIAHLANIGHASQLINEAVPGTVNTSGTASTLLNALKEHASTEGKAGHKLSIPAIVGPAIIGAMTHGAEGGGVGAGLGLATHLGQKALDPILGQRAADVAAQKLAKALKEASSADGARAAEAGRVKSVNAQKLRKARATAAALRANTVIANDNRKSGISRGAQ